jgi:VIT1/CCC1 family predicted Fe2+/Mn2+ transporter
LQHGRPALDAVGVKGPPVLARIQSVTVKRVTSLFRVKEKPSALTSSQKTGRALVLDELFDLSLYTTLRGMTRGALQEMLDELILTEKKHVAFWREFFGIELHSLDPWRWLKLRLLSLVCRLLGEPAIHLVLEAIEIHGVRKYLTLWECYQHDALGKAVRTILEEELQHEDRVVSAAIERRVDPERIRSLFLGFNDGLVEILGAVSGFFAAFQDAGSILIASSTVAVAGAFSMAAGAFVATSSEREITKLEAGKRAFLGERSVAATPLGSPFSAALIVGLSYLLGAIVPVLPVLLGARTLVASLAMGAAAGVTVSAILAFLSGMKMGRRLATNVAILAAAVAVTYAIGLAVKSLWGVSLP